MDAVTGALIGARFPSEDTDTRFVSRNCVEWSNNTVSQCWLETMNSNIYCSGGWKRPPLWESFYICDNWPLTSNYRVIQVRLNFRLPIKELRKVATAVSCEKHAASKHQSQINLIKLQPYKCIRKCSFCWTWRTDDKHQGSTHNLSRILPKRSYLR